MLWVLTHDRVLYLDVPASQNLLMRAPMNQQSASKMASTGKAAHPDIWVCNGLYFLTFLGQDV